jgi:type II restriction enzyme
LGDGVLYAADSDLNKIEDLYYPLIAVLREENQQIKKYEKSESVINIISAKGEQLLSLPMSEFQAKAELLLSAIKNADKTFAVPDIENFYGHYFFAQK